jgi:hypothetical protein
MTLKLPKAYEKKQHEEVRELVAQMEPLIKKVGGQPMTQNLIYPYS